MDIQPKNQFRSDVHFFCSTGLKYRARASCNFSNYSSTGLKYYVERVIFRFLCSTDHKIKLICTACGDILGWMNKKMFIWSKGWSVEHFWNNILFKWPKNILTISVCDLKIFFLDRLNISEIIFCSNDLKIY